MTGSAKQSSATLEHPTVTRGRRLPILIRGFVVGVIDRREAILVAAIMPAKVGGAGISENVLIDDIPVEAKMLHLLFGYVGEISQAVHRQHERTAGAGSNPLAHDDIIHPI